jgi:hypothetical protein
MTPRISVETKLTAHRAAALATMTLMRATNADMTAIIEQTRRLLEGGREALRQTNVLARISLLVLIVGW